MIWIAGSLCLLLTITAGALSLMFLGVLAEKIGAGDDNE